MSNIKNLCDIINSKLIEMIADDPFSAAVKLGTLYNLHPKSSDEEQELINSTILEIKKILTKDHLKLLWAAAVGISDVEWRLLSEGNKKSIEILKHRIICDFDFVKHIDNRALIKQSEDIHFYREVLIALIRKHLLDHNQVDPFAEKSFSYELLNQAGAEENYLYLSRYISQCATLPLEVIVMLGISKDNFAMLILKDLTSSDHKFEISARFAEQHETLRRKIAEDWRFYKATYVSSARVNEIMNVELKKLECFDEFKDVNAVRNERIFERLPTTIQESNFDIILRNMGLTGAAYGTLAILCPPLVINPIAPVVALGLGMGVSAYQTSESFRKKTIEYSQRCVHAPTNTSSDFRKNIENIRDYYFRGPR